MYEYGLLMDDKIEPLNHCSYEAFPVYHQGLRYNYNQLQGSSRNSSLSQVPIQSMSKSVSRTGCRTPNPNSKLTVMRGVLESCDILRQGICSLTALLARTLILERGINPTISTRADIPIGNTECGS